MCHNFTHISSNFVKESVNKCLFQSTIVMFMREDANSLVQEPEVEEKPEKFALMMEPKSNSSFVIIRVPSHQ